ncbi:hypothetical protein GCM10007924_25900 [Sneathiella chinensis]|uniref:PilZ domain-containing protein n=1 Tax=Sneathiella chinensis TaxID=349750 RepID=A0ABQ5U5F9_9PROT|nr:hypothetical protein GCM10007924_25900 [Sneathiella chinensis]
MRSGRRAVTGNATLAHQCLMPENRNGAPQIALLQNEKTDCSLISAPLRRIFGTGIKSEILHAYEFLGRHYRPGDHIYLIGAGRGAYSLHCLAMLVARAGILTTDSLTSLQQAYLYSKLDDETRNAPAGQELRKKFTSQPARIRFLGLWDSLGHRGTPTLGMQRLSRLWSEDTPPTLCENVEKAYQALALDEDNPAYEAMIWAGTNSSDQKCLKSVEQVWFTGRHENIIGGRRDCRLSDIAFLWLVHKAEEEGLCFNHEKIDDLTNPNPLGQLYKRRTIGDLGRRLFKRRYVRALGRADSHFTRQRIPDTEKIHESVHTRRNQDHSYHPLALNAAASTTLPVAAAIEVRRQSHRRFRRMRVNCPATLLVNAERYNGNLIDYSRGGARIWTPRELPVGTPITLRSALLFDSGMEGHVVWSHDQSVGVEFAQELERNQLQQTQVRIH